MKTHIDYMNMTDEELDALDDELYSLKKTNSRKSMAPLFIYLILKEQSNADRHFSQDEIAQILSRMPYEIKLERKAIGRIIHNLVDSDLGIYSLKGYGTWYSDHGIFD